VAAQTVPVPTTVQHREVDIVFPRNETYKAADAFPIVFAVQNLTALTSLGKYRLAWGITSFTDGEGGRGHRL
jgi:hypothetical protein